MSITLCLDFGNTRKKVAVFDEDKIIKSIVIDDDSMTTIQALLDTYKPHKSILSSVIDHNAAIEESLAAKTKFHKLNHLTKLSFTTPVGKPATIGADRLALIAAAVHFYPNRNNLVIGMGSCVTYNFINKYHEFLGGAISPGMEMRLKAMHQFTAKLPLVKADSNVPLIGYDTETNLLSGAVLGLAKEIDGFIDAYRERFGNFNALLTGGDLVHLASHLKNKIFADPELIFKGLYGISEVNNP
ncbi:MAG: type III pantothenate kinase [Bacteroidetes bacterium]|jgi:type III pantothenate kinase|nr:MAG: type III pantothenate kinase [Bacteroidota bacterium]